MKLASLKIHSSRDGLLCVVNRELTLFAPVDHIAKTLQEAIERWRLVAEKLQIVYEALNNYQIPNAQPFVAANMLSPLPRSYQWADGSAYVNHVELVRKARGAEMPTDFWTNPLLYQGGSDKFLGPREDIILADENYGLDFEAEIAVITDDVPMMTNAGMASQHIKLLMLVNDVSLRNLIPQEIAKGFGFYQSKPASSFSPVAITPDELKTHWDEKRVHLPLCSYVNSNLFGQPNAGIDMTFSFPELIAHAAKTRDLAAGSILGSGTVSNLNRNVGSSCIVEKRMLEILAKGHPSTAYLKYGDIVKIEMLDPEGLNLFGSIEQKVIPYLAKDRSKS